jgi:hypothetical protein
MEVEIGLPAAIPGVEPDQLLEWARRAEARGFSTLGTIDRIVYATTSRSSRWPPPRP